MNKTSTENSFLLAIYWELASLAVPSFRYSPNTILTYPEYQNSHFPLYRFRLGWIFSEYIFLCFQAVDILEDVSNSKRS